MSAVLDRPVAPLSPPVGSGSTPAPLRAEIDRATACARPLPGPDGSPGPDLPPLLRGLPHTDINACKSLLGAVLWQAIQDMDIHFIASNGFTNYGVLMGLELSEVFAIRRQVLSGQFKPSLYSGIPWNSDYDR